METGALGVKPLPLEKLSQFLGHSPDGLGSPRTYCNLLISLDSLGHLFLRVQQSDKNRHVSLSEIRRKNCHSVPDWWMDMKSVRQESGPRKSGTSLCWSNTYPSVTCLPDRRVGSRAFHSLAKKDCIHFLRSNLPRAHVLPLPH